MGRKLKVTPMEIDHLIRHLNLIDQELTRSARKLSREFTAAYFPYTILEAINVLGRVKQHIKLTKVIDDYEEEINKTT